jgi:hypothetical protein
VGGQSCLQPPPGDKHANNDGKLTELTALISGIRGSIRQRHPNGAIAAGVAVDLISSPSSTPATPPSPSLP